MSYIIPLVSRCIKVASMAHNPEAVGSNPTPATKFRHLRVPKVSKLVDARNNRPAVIARPIELCGRWNIAITWPRGVSCWVSVSERAEIER